MLTNKIKATEVQEPFVPLVALENAFRYWWIVATAIVIGGLGGLLLHALNPPLFEASADFSIAIDYVSTGPLTQYEEDMAINTAGNIFVSEELLQKVVDQAGEEGIKLSLLDLREQSFLERKFSLWTLRVRDANPQVAERLAKIWMNQGEAILRLSYAHAIQAYYLDLYIQSQESCLEKVGMSEPAFEACSSARFPDIQNNLRDAGTALFQERQASRGLFAGLTIGPFNSPVVSPQPVTNGRNQYVFVGSLLGLLVGIALIELGTAKFRGMKS